MPAHQGKFVAYFRVSTDRQGKSGLGLAAQRKAVLDYLDGGRWQLVAEFTEVESGKHSDRPELEKALATCKRQKAKLVIAKLDRLSRNLAFIATLMDSGVEFIAVDDPHANKLTIHILAAVAQHEREIISARTSAALRAAKAARWVYSELLSPTQRKNYEQHGGLSSTIWDKKTLAVPFDDLEPQERLLLRSAWGNVRGNGTIFGAAVHGVGNFRLVHWSKDELADAYVIPMFADEATLDANKPLTFQRWLETEPKRPLHPYHAWNAGEDQESSSQQNQDPALSARMHLVTVLGPPNQSSYTYGSAAYMLLDGYHRAVWFYKRGNSKDKLAIYVPS